MAFIGSAGGVTHYYTYEPTLQRLRIWDARSSTHSLHTKLYIVDDLIAYLGSANFTYSGFKNNHECMVAVEDHESVAALSGQIDELCSNNNEPFLTDLSYLGRRVYGGN